RRTWARNIVPNLPAPISPTVIGRPAASRASSLACRFIGTHGLRYSRTAQRRHTMVSLGAKRRNLAPLAPAARPRWLCRTQVGPARATILCEKSATPDQVRDRHFRDHAQYWQSERVT